MWDKIVLTLGTLSLVSTLGVGFVWAQGGFETHPRFTSVDQRTAQPLTPWRATYGDATPHPEPTEEPFGTPATDQTEAAAPKARTVAAAARPATASSALVGRTVAGVPVTAGRVIGTDPTTAADPTATATPTPTTPSASFNVATFNLLGSSHTAGSGSRASGVTRMAGALQIIAQHDVSVVGLQEFQPDQRAAFTRSATGWQMYPGLSMGRRAGENSVAWRSDTWTKVDQGLVDIPYFYGRTRPMPYVLLKNVASGRTVYVSTFHNPADVHGPAQRWRTEATTREVALFNKLQASGVPQIVTGDMNERANYFCRITGETPLHAAAGGSHTGTCQAPKPIGIDWIFGSPTVSFSNYTVDRSDLVRRTTDHPVVVASVQLG